MKTTLSILILVSNISMNALAQTKGNANIRAERRANAEPTSISPMLDAYFAKLVEFIHSRSFASPRDKLALAVALEIVFSKSRSCAEAAAVVAVQEAESIFRAEADDGGIARILTNEDWLRLIDDAASRAAWHAAFPGEGGEQLLGADMILANPAFNAASSVLTSWEIWKRAVRTAKQVALRELRRGSSWKQIAAATYRVAEWSVLHRCLFAFDEALKETYLATAANLPETFEPNPSVSEAAWLEFRARRLENCQPNAEIFLKPMTTVFDSLMAAPGIVQFHLLRLREDCIVSVLPAEVVRLICLFVAFPLYNKRQL